MIVNLERFIAEEQPRWRELEVRLQRLADDPWRRLTLEEARELEQLYQRAAADLARLASFAVAPEARRQLEELVARGHAEIHGGRGGSARLQPWRWFAHTLPQTWRRRAQAFWFAGALVLAGALFGGGAIAFDPAAKNVLMPFPQLRGDPAKRVADEEAEQGRDLVDRKASFAGMLMTHNTQVTLSAAAFGMTAGLGTLILMLYNGVGLGAVVVDYLRAGQAPFLFGWLLPHGAVEIPAMLIGGQAGFVLAGAMLARGRRATLATRLREVAPDVVTLCLGAALLLVWAGIVEAFLSQYHEPVLPYFVKIVFGVVELGALAWFLARSGRPTEGRR